MNENEITNQKLLLELNLLKNENASLKELYNKDINEFRNIEKELRDSEKRYRSLYIDSREAIMIFSIEQGIISGNPAAIKLFACRDEQDFISRSPSTLSPEYQPDGQKSADKSLAMMEIAHKNGSNFFEWTHRTANGNEFPATVFISRLEINGTQMLQATISDVSESKLVKEKLQESEELFRSTFEQVAVGLAHVAIDGKWIRVNKRICEMLGYSYEEIIDKSFQDFTHPDELAADVSNLHKIMANEIQSFTKEKRYIRKDGTTLWANLTVTAKRDTSGKIEYMISVIEDISERKHAEEALRETEDRYRSLYESSPDAIMISIPGQQILSANPAACNMFGRTEDEICNMTRGELIDRNTSLPDKLKLLEQSGKFKGELTFIRKDGYSFPGEISTSEFFDKHGNKRRSIFIRDISESKRIENEIRARDEQLRDIASNIPGVIYQFIQQEDGQFKTLFMSSGGEQLFERPLAELMDASLIFSDIHPDDLPGFIQSILLSAQNLTQWNYEFRIVKPGKIKWLSGNSNPHRVINKGIYWNGILLDITESKQSKNELEKRNSFIQTVLDNLPMGIALNYIDNGNTFYINKKFEEVYGWSRSDMEDIDDFFRKVYPDEKYRGKLITRIMSDIHSGDISKMHWEDCLITRKDGSERIINAVNIPLPEQNTMVSTVVDMTDLKNTVKNLRKLSRAVEQSQVSIIITNKEAVIEYVNPKFLEVTGYSMDEVVGKNPRLLKSGETIINYKEMWDTLASNNEWSGIFHNRKKNGELFWESATISPVRNELGEITNYVAVKEDITVKMELEISLQKALEKAEESNKLKSSLMANMSHELRTPMTGIMGFTDILMSEIEDPSQRYKLELIYSSAKRLMNSLNSVLDFAQMQSNSDNFRKKKININEFIDNSVKTFHKAAESKKIKLVSITGDNQVFIYANEKMIKVLLSNLMDNAIKFTEKGVVTVSLTTEYDNNINYAVIRVKDTGIGIDIKDQVTIFEEFRQASEGLNRIYEGLGLGLALVKKILLDINGKIDAKSKLNEGTEFKISIPLIETKTLIDEGRAKLKKQSLEINDGNIPLKKHILYVEDNYLNAMVVKNYLSNKYEMHHASNATEALNKVNEMVYDLLLMDINLGFGADGIELTKLIKEIKEYKNVPIIAVTGYALHNDKENIIKEGLTDYLAKPFNKAELNEIVLKNIMKIANK